MIQIRISEEAVRDLQEGFLFYEAQERGLGDYFVTCLRADIERLRVHAGIHRIVYKDYRRLLGKVFPYGLFYTVEADCVILWAVIDLRRDPEWIRQRLKG